MSIKSVMPSNHLIFCHPLLLLPLIFPSIRVFSNESVLRIRWPSIGASASASVPPMNIQDWFPLGLTGFISLKSKGNYTTCSLCFLHLSQSISSVTQSCPTLWPHGLQHSRPSCPSPTPGVYPNSHPLSRWCRLTISSSVIPFSSCPQSFPASESF